MFSIGKKKLCLQEKICEFRSCSKRIVSASVLVVHCTLCRPNIITTLFPSTDQVLRVADPNNRSPLPLSNFNMDLGSEPTSSRVLLLSLTDASSGLNLTVASHVIMVHPMSAEDHVHATSIEMQAIGRVGSRSSLWSFLSVVAVFWGRRTRVVVGTTISTKISSTRKFYYTRGVSLWGEGVLSTQI